MPLFAFFIFSLSIAGYNMSAINNKNIITYPVKRLHQLQNPYQKDSNRTTLKRSLNTSVSSKNLSHFDSSRIYGNSSIINYYYVDVFFGYPPKKQTLIIDTGSGNTGIPCGNLCKPETCGEHLNSYYNPLSKTKVIT
jgi:hypothetical protein